ncbi:MAG: hypothetical protein NVSMB3_07690 [Acidobacteriaceae bacterium]
MPPPNVPLHELNAAVQSAVERVLAQHGAVPVDKLWVGFVAPEQIATMDNATKISSVLSKELGIHGTASVAQIGGSSAPGAGNVGGGHAVHAEALPKPGHLIGLVYKPELLK